MFTLDDILLLIQSQGLWLLAPFAVAEGPIVTVIAAYLAQRGYLPVLGVYLVCVLGDLIGDILFYALGRFGPTLLPIRWQNRLGLTSARKLALGDHFAEKGGRTLLFGKWTHSAGLPILIASGMGRMNFAAYVGFNLAATLPKTLLFVVLGSYIGQAYALIDTYLYLLSLLLLATLVLAAAVHVGRQWRKA